METKIQKWGNSLGIRIPNALVKSLSLKPNDELEISEQDKKIVIVKPDKTKISLEDRIKKYNSKNIINDFSWDEARENEIW